MVDKLSLFVIQWVYRMRKREEHIVKRILGTSENQCGACGNYRKARKISAEILPQYGRCAKHTVVDVMSDGKAREETRRPAIRFATDSCEQFK